MNTRQRQAETRKNVLEVVEEATEDENNATLAMNDALDESS